jgi:hypothetical protein
VSVLGRAMFKFKAFAIALSIPFLMGMSACGDCYKTYTFSGTVTDQGSTPLAGVQVNFGNPSTGTSSEVSFTTDSSGRFSYISRDTRANYAGTYLVFSKTGYQTQNSAAFSESEAGPDVCGDVSLTRNAALSP